MVLSRDATVPVDTGRAMCLRAVASLVTSQRVPGWPLSRQPGASVGLTPGEGRHYSADGHGAFVCSENRISVNALLKTQCFVIFFKVVKKKKKT